MQYEIFTVPLSGGEHAIDEMNRFIASHKVVSVDKHCVDSGGMSCWTFCVSYMPVAPAAGEAGQAAGGRHGDIDYRDVLEPEAFSRFTLLRQCRKQLALSKALPVYAVFTNAELALLAQMSELEPSALSSVKGIGRQRVQKYGLALLKLYHESEAAAAAVAAPAETIPDGSDASPAGPDDAPDGPYGAPDDVPFMNDETP